MEQSRKHWCPSLSKIVCLPERDFPVFTRPNDVKGNPSKRCNVCSKNGRRKESRYNVRDTMLDYIITQKGTFLTFSGKYGVVFAIISKGNDFLKLKPGFVMVLPIYFATI